MNSLYVTGHVQTAMEVVDTLGVAWRDMLWFYSEGYKSKLL